MMNYHDRDNLIDVLLAVWIVGTIFAACLLLSSCAHAPTPVAPTKHAACSTAASPELASCPYREELPKTRLYTSSGLECQHCNVAEFSR